MNIALVRIQIVIISISYTNGAGYIHANKNFMCLFWSFSSLQWDVTKPLSMKQYKFSIK